MKKFKIELLKQLNTPLQDASEENIRNILEEQKVTDTINIDRIRSNLLEKIEQFKKRCYNNLPALRNLKLSEKIWQDIFLQYQSDKRTKLSTSYLLYCIEKAGLDPMLLKKELRARKARENAEKKLSSQNQSESQPKIKNRSKTAATPPQEKALMSPKSPSLASSLSSHCLFKPLQRINSTPSSSYKKKFQSPEGSLYYQAATIDGQPVYLEITPDKERSVLKKSPIEKNKTQPGPYVSDMKYVVTLKAMQQRKGNRRVPDQRQLFDKSSREYFIEHGDENAKNRSGRLYHFSHIHAFYQGGEQSRDNLLPTTAQANYKTLKFVEKPIEKLLKTNCTDKVEVLAKSYYSNKKSRIPIHIHYQLSWIDKTGKLHQEDYDIDPRSHRKTNRSALKTIETLRKLPAKPEESSSPGLKK